MKMLNAIILGVATTALLLFAAPPLQAVEYSLTAKAGTVTMPDGASVPVWGLVEGTNPPLTPVPMLIDTAGATLTITLTNQLPEAVSLVINGQTPSEVGAMAPVFFTDDNGRQRVFSFTHEAAANGGTATYTWTNLRPGTYLITSGSHPSVQVPMGLYAALKVGSPVAGEAYPGLQNTYTKELPLLFSEIDPVLNQAVTAGIYGDPAGAYPTALKVGYKPKYFLLNGRPWSAGAPTLAVYDTANALSTIAVGDTVLLRMLNAGLRARAPLFPGQALTMIAEDGNPFNYQPTQSTADLVAGKTLDALLTVAADGYLPFHDRMLGLAGGGMFGYLAVGTPAVTLTVAVTGPGSVSAISLAGGIACPGDCSETYLTGTAVTLKALPTNGNSALSSWSVTAGGAPTGECTTFGNCVVTLDQAKSVTATFATFTELALVSPNGGEQFALDATVPIHWSAPEGVHTFDIGYSAGPGSPFRLIAERVAGREFLWNLAAANLRPSNGVRLAIISYDAAGNVVGRDTSEAPFSIVSPITLTAPNGGSIAAGSSHLITWSVRPTTPTATRASLWYQSAPAAAWSLIADVNPASGTYTWTVPTALTTTGRVALTIYDPTGKAIATDTSDATFSIVSAAPAAMLSSKASTSNSANSGNSFVAAEAVPAPDSASVSTEKETELALLFPNSGEVLPGETPFTVLWQTPADAVAFSLDYSLDGGQNWRSLAKDLDDSQFNWQIDPALRGSKSVLLRVTAFGAKGEVMARDLGDEAFSID